jgi:hypothetical protein
MNCFYHNSHFQKLTQLGLILILTLLSFPSTGLAQKIQYLGSTRLSHRENDLDILRFPTCQKPPLQSIKLKVVKGSAELNVLWVRYDNNAIDRLSVREKILQGGETRWIDLRGNRRCVKAIGVIGTTKLSLNQTQINFLGK